MRGECTTGVKTGAGLSKDHWLCAVRGGEFRSVGEGRGGSCLLPRGGGQEYYSLDSKGKIVHCNCDPNHSAKCWKKEDGLKALQRREARGEGAVHPRFGHNALDACRDAAHRANKERRSCDL